MSFKTSNILKIVCSEIEKKCESNRTINRFEFAELLKILSAFEKFFLAKYFCNLEWNVGSIKVLSILQKQRILTATEFIIGLNDTHQIQLILNDFLETEYELVHNLFVSMFYDSFNAIRLSVMLDECIHRLLIDLLKNPSLNNFDYLKTLNLHLPHDLFFKLTQKHIIILLDLHNSSIKEAFKNFSTWINQGVDEIKFTSDIYKKLICSNEQESFAYLMKLSTSEHFKGWKFLLILLQKIANLGSIESTTNIRKYFKLRLRQIALVPNINAMFHLLLAVRAATAITMDVNKNIDIYADWYKQNIADMKFVLKTDEFQNIIHLLEQCIPYEVEISYLQVHCIISISPPVLCGRLVQGYKSKCRLRLSQLKESAKVTQTNESVVIEDSD